MFSRFFGTPKQQQIDTVSTLDHLMEKLEFHEKKEKHFQKKVADEVEKAKEFTRAKNKRAAIKCLKMKKLYEQQIEGLGDSQMRIQEQMILLEGAKTTYETVEALKTGASSLKTMQKAMKIDDIDKTMEEIHQQSDNMKQIQEALSTPFGASADFDEDELEAELEELEGSQLEECLLQPIRTSPAEAPAQALSTTQAHLADDDELAALQAELAL